MTLLQALVLGAVQGATEFLPISSSGHLVLVPWLLGWELDPEAAFVFDVLVQLGTLMAVILIFRQDLIRLIRAAIEGLRAGQPLANHDAKLAWILVAASVPGALLGVLLKENVEAAFSSIPAVSVALLVTAGLLVLSERLGERSRSMSDLGWLDALLVGAFQAAALFPGISRSGATIAGGMWRKLRRPEAARFSFLMAVPIMLGAGSIAVLDLAQSATLMDQLGSLVAGFVMAALVGYAAIRWFLAYLSQRPLYPFAAYCALVGLTGLIMSGLRG